MDALQKVIPLRPRVFQEQWGRDFSASNAKEQKSIWWYWVQCYFWSSQGSSFTRNQKCSEKRYTTSDTYAFPNTLVLENEILLDLFLTLFTRAPNVFEGRTMCLYKIIWFHFFPNSVSFSGSCIIILKTFGEWQNYQIYKVKATIFQDGFLICLFWVTTPVTLPLPQSCQSTSAGPLPGSRHLQLASPRDLLPTAPCDSSPQGRLHHWLTGSYSGAIRPI